MGLQRRILLFGMIVLMLTVTLMLSFKTKPAIESCHRRLPLSDWLDWLKSFTTSADPSVSDKQALQALIVSPTYAHYENGVHSLPGSKIDTKIMSRLLKKNGFSVKQVSDRDKSNMRSAIKESIHDMVCNAKDKGILVFYYTGHGETDGMVCTWGDQCDNISGTDLRKYFSRIYSHAPKHITWLVVFDCCHSGNMMGLEFRWDTDRHEFRCEACGNTGEVSCEKEDCTKGKTLYWHMHKTCTRPCPHCDRRKEKEPLIICLSACEKEQNATEVTYHTIRGSIRKLWTQTTQLNGILREVKRRGKAPAVPFGELVTRNFQSVSRNMSRFKKEGTTSSSQTPVLSSNKSVPRGVTLGQILSGEVASALTL